jgi:hypothetical protein
VTTSSGKPPFDEQPLDTSWDADDSPTAGPDSSAGDPPTPRQPARGAASAEDDDAPMYGAGVPYGGDDRTEEIEPIGLDVPFASDDRKTPAAPAAAPVTPRAPGTTRHTPVAPPARDYEMAAPAKQLLLSDLFDSTPSSSTLSPPDPAAFSSNRPPPAEATPKPAPAVIALPSIDVGGSPRAGRVEPEGAARAPMPTPTRAAMDTPVPAAAPAIAAPPARSAMATPVPAATPVVVPPARSAMPTPVPAASAAADTPPARSAMATPVPAVAPGMGAPPARAPMDTPVPAATPVADATARAPMFTPVPAAAPSASGVTSDADEDDDATPTPGGLSEYDGHATQRMRRSVPTLESVDHARSRAAAGSPNAPSSPAATRVLTPPTGSNPSHAIPRAAQSPTAPALLTEHPGDGPASTPPISSEATSDPIAHFPSEVPTSRPPDVALNPALQQPGAAASARPEVGVARESKPSRAATVTAPVTSQAAKAQSQLPSIMLAADVEAEPDISARRAMRAARATVRLELPPNFGRPGSPVPRGPVPGVSPPISFGPGAPSLPASASHAFDRDLPWLANPQNRRLIGFALAAVLLVVMLVIALSPRSGSLVVTALAPGNRAVDDVTIFVDGQPLCGVSPCRIKGLSPGMHTLRASAPNLASQAEETVEITAGDEATYNIDLLAVAPEVRGGGLRIAATDTPLTLHVDGKRVGKLPQEISGLSSGKHWIKLDPEDGSPPIEKSVNVLAGEIVDVEPTPARRDKSLVTIRLSRGSEGALVTFDDAFLLDFPAELELEPNTVHTLSATKPGFEDLNMEVRVGADEAEKLVEVSLTPVEGNAPARKARPKVARKPTATKGTAPASTALADATQGLLNISSVPPSQIILNGRPLGSTPKTGITVPGDSLQTIVFVHPKMGRRRAQKFVPAGKERTVSIRF